MLVFVAFFAIGSGPVTWVLLSEVLPPSIKGPAASLATVAGWAGEFGVLGSEAWMSVKCVELGESLALATCAAQPRQQHMGVANALLPTNMQLFQGLCRLCEPC